MKVGNARFFNSKNNHFRKIAIEVNMRNVITCIFKISKFLNFG